MAYDPKAALDAATVKTGDKVTGILALSPDGNLVRLRPGSVRLGASVEQGVFIVGLKPGWKLADSAAIAEVKKRSEAGEKSNPRGKPSPKKATA
jgi:hypothetical protein